jgi:hypothetical protein
MPHHQTKIATCCYCGRRQTLRPTARAGHELACGACGAPLHEMKWLKAGHEGAEKPSPPRPAPHGADWPGRAAPLDPRRRKKRKKRKGLLHKAFEEAFDLIEDIFD